MAKKKTQAASNGAAHDVTETTAAVETPQEPTTTSPSEGTSEQQPEGNGHAGNDKGQEKRRPVFKVGPIPTDKDNSVEAAVWDRVVQTRDGREFTVYSVTCQANWRDSNGYWSRSSNFRGSQIYALQYCLARCSDFILSMRDSANCPI